MEVVFLIVLIALMVLALSSGFPVAFALPGSAIGAILLAAVCGAIFTGDPGAYFAQDGPVQWLTAGVTNFRSLYWEVERDTLIAIPLFVFMGIMLQRSKIAEDLLVAMAQLFGPVPGGLGISVVFVGALLAATTGILGATVIAMGLISLPAMLRNNYSKPIATGTICASGTLGQIIPPSIVLIILADQLANAADQARTLRAAEYRSATGEFSMPAELDITSASAGDMFMGALIPGLVLVGLYMLYILIRAVLRPGTAPPVPYAGEYNRQFALKISISLIPPLALIFAVLGSIVTGVATVNQAGAIGAVGAIVMGGYRLLEGGRHRYTPLILAAISLLVIFILQRSFDLNVKNIKDQRDLLGILLAASAVLVCIVAIVWSTWRTFKIDDTLVSVMIDTAKTTSMVFVILIGAAMLTAAFRGFGGEHLVREFLTGLPGGFWSQFMVVMLVIFLLGFFLDFIEIAVVVVPIVAPILLADPSANVTAVWLGVMIGLNIQTSFLTPPFGFALFYLRGVAPPEVKTTHIYKGAVAFIALQLVGLGIAGYFPPLVNYMPNLTYLTSETAPPPINPRLQQCIEQRVFPEYLENQEAILAQADQVRSQNLALLPASHREKLLAALTQFPAVFDHARMASEATVQLDDYLIEYKPVHRDVRQIRNQIKNIDGRIESTQDRVGRLQRSNAEAGQIAALQNTIVEDETERQLLLEQIPESWEQANAEYKALAKLDKANRTMYRRSADEAYQPIKDLLAIYAGTDSLAALQTAVAELPAVVDEDGETAIEKIKSVESALSDHAGATAIKSPITKARRALAQDDPDRQSARELLALGLENMQNEIAWRTGSQAVADSLSALDNVIKNNIGLRLQKGFDDDVASDIAGCLSVHKDISMHFQ